MACNVRYAIVKILTHIFTRSPYVKLNVQDYKKCKPEYWQYCRPYRYWRLIWVWHWKLDGCIVWNAHNTVFGSKRSAICAQAFTSCIRLWGQTEWYSHAWVMSVLSAVLLTFIYQFRSAFLPCQSAKPHNGVHGLPNIGRCQKFG